MTVRKYVFVIIGCISHKCLCINGYKVRVYTLIQTLSILDGKNSILSVYTKMENIICGHIISKRTNVMVTAADGKER